MDDDRAAERLRRQFDDARAKGAKVLVGGEINERFVSPTVFAGVTPDMLLYQEESFGPVCSIFNAKNDDDAVRIANDSSYGLSGMVTSGSLDRAMAVARRIRTGTVGVNGGSYYSPDVPFGGFKDSGVGRQNGTAGFDQYLEIQSLAFPAS